MSRIYTTIQIPRPVEEVFNYVTAPQSWPQWHPSSIGVSGATDHSLEVGEQVVEEFIVAGRQGKATWTVKERVFPHRWVIDGLINGSRNGGVVTYQLTPRSGGTFFEREFVYPTRGFLFTVLDLLVIKRRVKAESKLALKQLQAAMTK